MRDDDDWNEFQELANKLGFVLAQLNETGPVDEPDGFTFVKDPSPDAFYPETPPSQMMH
jgi:hypothetical protein